MAVAGIAALAEVDLWTAMHARVTGVVIVLTVFIRFWWLAYRSAEVAGWFLALAPVGAIAGGTAAPLLGVAPWSETHLHVTAGGMVGTISAHVLWDLWWNADDRAAVWPYLVSGAAAAVAVAGIAALAEVELWTAMQARVTGVVIVLTVFMHYCWLGYLSEDRPGSFVGLATAGAIAGAAAPLFVGFAPWSEIHLHVTAGGMVGTISADILWHLWWNADHRVADRERRWNLQQAAAAREEEQRKADMAAQKAAVEEARRKERKARRFASGRKVQLRWSDPTHKHLESVRIDIPARNPDPRYRGLSQRVEVEDATPAEVIALLQELRKHGGWSADLLERGLEEKRLAWWREYHRKEVETPYLAVTLNVERTRAESANVRKGPFEGKPLSALTRREFEQLLKVLDREDRRGAQFAGQVFSRRTNEGRGPEPGTRPNPSSRNPHMRDMTIEKARAVLGIDRNDTPQEMRTKAKKVIADLHSDQKNAQGRRTDLRFQYDEAKAAHDLLEKQVWGRRS